MRNDATDGSREEKDEKAMVPVTAYIYRKSQPGRGITGRRTASRSSLGGSMCGPMGLAAGPVSHGCSTLFPPGRQPFYLGSVNLTLNTPFQCVSEMRNLILIKYRDLRARTSQVQVSRRSLGFRFGEEARPIRRRTERQHALRSASDCALGKSGEDRLGREAKRPGPEPTLLSGEAAGRCRVLVHTCSVDSDNS